MRYLEVADNAADVSRIITKNLDFLSSTALLIFRALHEIAVEACEARGYSPGVSEVALFCPVEAVALALGMHRSTVYRALPELRAAGLLDVRGHYCTHRGRTRADGAVWSVRLRPVGGRAARVGYSDLKRQYRDLGGDIAAGRTVWAEMRQSKDNPLREINLDLVRRWALPPSSTKSPLPVDCRMASRRSLEAVLDAPHVERGDRARVVDLGAQALATALRDRGGTGFYRKLLWQLLRRFDATGEDHSYSVYLAAQRARTDAQEGFARRPGALFVSRLKAAPWWDAVMHQPQSRVAAAPSEVVSRGA
jgi:DNA-binding transcriptional ArsR family regulator